MENENTNPNVEVITAYNRIPYNIINKEVQGTSKQEFLEELGSILKLYEVYNNGADFTTEGSNGDYIAANLKYKTAKSILNKEVRFLFSKTPDVSILPIDASNKADKKMVNTWQKFIDRVLKRNSFSLKLLRAAKDCFIGKRVAAILNFNDNGVRLAFMNALEFYYETNPNDVDELIKITTFYKIHESRNSTETRIFVKRYWLENGYCHVEEIIYNGNGAEIEIVTPSQATNFTYIPAVIVTNDGLTGDTHGESEIATLCDYESWYSKLSNADMDAERKSMNPTKYAMDCSPESTADLSSAAGAFWDLTSDQNSATDKQGSVGILEANMTYKDALKVTLDRIKNTMYEEVDVPNTTSEALQGVVTSGKTLKAIYWGLIVRCDEKMLTWKPALEFIVNTIIDGVLLYPNSALPYTNDRLSYVDLEVSVTNNYPLPEDEVEEKTIDLAEINSQTMSKKAYMKKWRGLSDEEIDEELKQIALERQLLEDSFSLPPLDDSDTVSDETNTNNTEEEEPDKEGEPDDGEMNGEADK